MSKYKLIHASNPTPGQEAELAADAAAMIKQKLEGQFNLDPRRPLDLGTLVASCRNLELTFQKRAEHSLPTIGVIAMFAVFGRRAGTDEAAVYLGNEVRRSDGQIVAQRIRSPESAVAFKTADATSKRHEKEANLFIANWVDNTALPPEWQKRLVVARLPSDLTAGKAFDLSWYARKHMVGAGRVDLRPALSFLCEEMDRQDAETKTKAAAKAAAEAEVAAAHQPHAKRLLNSFRHGEATVAEIRKEARGLGIPGITSKATASDLRHHLMVAAGEIEAAPVSPVTAEAKVTEVTWEQLTAINVALNLLGGEGGEKRLRDALRAAKVKVQPSQETWVVNAVKAAKACRCAEPVAV